MLERKGQYTILIFLTTILFSCGKPATYNSVNFKKLIGTPGTEIIDSSTFLNSVIYKIYQDEGAIGSHSFFLFHKKSSNFYHRLRLSKYTTEIWSTYILQTCNEFAEPSDTGKWIKKEVSGTVYFEPKIDSLIHKTQRNMNREGLFRLENGKLTYYGKLTDYCSFDDLDTGFYFLTPPSIFYSEKIDIKELETKYD